MSFAINKAMNIFQYFLLCLVIVILIGTAVYVLKESAKPKKEYCVGENISWIITTKESKPPCCKGLVPNSTDNVEWFCINTSKKS
jgi:ABC-type glycerol-3-phosphate transport system permease component